MEANLRFRDSPYGQRFRIDETPWLKGPLACIPDNEVEEIWLCCAAQLGKTTIMQGGVAWSLVESPGPSMVVMDSNDAAKDLAENKLNPTLESCKYLADQFPNDRSSKKKLKIQFPQATLMMGPANNSFLRSHSIRWLWCDEVSKYLPGNVARAKARTKRFQNRRRFFSSTPELDGDDFSIGWKGGTQEEWALQCQGCGELILPEFHKVMVWDDNEKTHPGDLWDYLEVRKTVRLKCPHCEHQHEHTAANIRAMNGGGGYIRRNPEGTNRIRSFRFNALCLPPSVLSWGDLVEEFLRAKVEARKGYTSPLKEFVNLQLAEFWDESEHVGTEQLELGDYEPSEEWPDEAMRFLTVDCQHELADFWAVARAWSREGESRLIAFRRPKSFDEIQALAEELNIPPNRVFLDIGYERATVLGECSRRRWVGLRGEDHESYLHIVKDGETSKRRQKLFSQIKRERVGNLPFAPAVIRWSNPTVKDILNRLKRGRGAKWGVCDVGALTEQYQTQLDSERKREIVNKATGQTSIRWVKFRENHGWDCECMQVVAAAVARLFAVE